MQAGGGAGLRAGRKRGGAECSQGRRQAIMCVDRLCVCSVLLAVCDVVLSR